MNNDTSAAYKFLPTFVALVATEPKGERVTKKNEIIVYLQQITKSLKRIQRVLNSNPKKLFSDCRRQYSDYQGDSHSGSVLNQIFRYWLGKNIPSFFLKLLF